MKEEYTGILSDYLRMCRAYVEYGNYGRICNKCPIYTAVNSPKYSGSCPLENPSKLTFGDMKKIEVIISDWAAENPVVTRFDKFAQVFDIKMDEESFISYLVDSFILGPRDKLEDRLHDWFLTEYEPPVEKDDDEDY